MVYIFCAVVFDAVLFDLDGTLTDPGVGIVNSVRHALRTLDLQVPSTAELRGFIGPPLQDSFAALGLSPVQVDAAVTSYREYFSSIGLYENVVYDGIAEVLAQLRRCGVALAVATSKPTVFAQRVLDHFDLNGPFDAVVGAELDGTRRHKNEVIAAALDALSLPSSAAVMVGDRRHDVIGARRCGISCVGVEWGYAAAGELEAAGATAVVGKPTELLDWLLAPADGVI